MIRLAARCRPEHADRVLPHLLDLAPNGLEEERGPGWVEYAIYGAPGEVPDLGDLRAAAGDAVVDVSASAVPDDWADRWSEFHKPVEVAGRIRVRPSWEPAAGDAIDVVIDPGQAFGTGAHPTTRLCLKLLIELVDRGEVRGSLADWGTGSGVLAIAAAKLGWGPILACDREAASLEAARGNADANEIELELTRVDLREQAPPVASTVVANLTAPLLEEAAARLAKPAAPRRTDSGAPRPVNAAARTVVCSGVLERESNQVIAAFRPLGLELAERRREGDWAALVLAR